MLGLSALPNRWISVTAPVLAMLCVPCFPDQTRGDEAVDNAQHPPHDLGPAGKQEAQRKRETQHPLAHSLFRQNLIDKQSRAFGHTPGTATGAKAAALTTECDKVFSMARLAAHPQKAMLQPATFQKFFEFPLHITRQFPALLC